MQCSTDSQNNPTARCSLLDGQGASGRALLLAVGLGLFFGPPAPAEIVDQVILRVNDQIVTSYDYETQLADRRQAIRMAEMPEARRHQLMENSGYQIFREIYEDLLLRSRAKQLGLFATEAEVAGAVANSRERMGITNDAEMEQALAASGMTLDQLEEKMRQSILVQQVVGREIRSKIEIEDEELRKIYREREEELTIPAGRRVEEVVVLEDQIPSVADRQAKAEQLLSAVRGGESFVDVADRMSSLGATSGVIDLGWVEPGHLAPELEEAVWALEIDAFSEPIESRGGTHVVHLVETREPELRAFEDVRDQLEAEERDRRMTDAYRDYLLDLEAEAFVEMRVPSAAEGFQGLASDADGSDDSGGR